MNQQEIIRAFNKCVAKKKKTKSFCLQQKMETLARRWYKVYIKRETGEYGTTPSNKPSNYLHYMYYRKQENCTRLYSKYGLSVIRKPHRKYVAALISKVRPIKVIAYRPICLMLNIDDFFRIDIRIDYSTIKVWLCLVEKSRYIELKNESDLEQALLNIKKYTLDEIQIIKQWQWL
jgi:hypothetical protein